MGNPPVLETPRSSFIPSKVLLLGDLPWALLRPSTLILQDKIYNLLSRWSLTIRITRLFQTVFSLVVECFDAWNELLQISY